jgi:16S rRNA G527 N7-methylase RsmG
VIGLLKLQNVSTFCGTIEQYTKQSLSNTIDMVVIRALKFEEIRKYLPNLLNSNGKVLLYRTENIKKQEIGEEFHLVNETDLILPEGSGRRVITVIQIYSKD